MTKHCEPFVDIHCHILPGLDDGAATLEQAIAMAEMAVADGIGTIVATPHQLGNHADNSADSIRRAATQFQRVLDARRLPLRVLPGADVRIEPDLVARIRAHEVLSLADQRRYVLLELPHEVYVPLDRLLGELAAAGMTGILSHPERNRGILNRPDVLPPLVKAGCLLQITAGSLTGTFGSQIQRFSEALLQQGLVHFISTDAHGTRSRPPLLRPAFDCAASLLGKDAATRLCCRNPAAVALGERVASRSPIPGAFSWVNRLCRPFFSFHASSRPI